MTGFIVQSVSLIGIILGFAAGAAVALWVSDRVVDPNLRAAAAILTLFAIIIIFYAGGAAIGTHIRARVPDGWLRGIDAAAGVVTAMAGVAIVVWLIAVPIAQSPFTTASEAMKESATMRVVRSFPPPTGFLEGFRSALNSSGFPTVFENLPAPFGGPTSPPDPAIASNPAVATVGTSTVKILTERCGAGSEGSGWVFADDYVATNAHVVAGTRSNIEIETQTGRSFSGDIVAFDPAADVAVIHVQDLPLPPVIWTTEVAPNDLSVAALGYPDNGPFVVTPGRIHTELNARGRDIYDDRTVERSVYEVGTRVRPGNSGGPLVADSGLVYGMIFAASSTDGDIGYALTGGEITSVLDAANGSVGAVSTGPCMN